MGDAYQDLLKQALTSYVQSIKDERSKRLDCVGKRLHEVYGVCLIDSEPLDDASDPHDPFAGSLPGHGTGGTSKVFDYSDADPDPELLVSLKDLNHPCIFRAGAVDYGCLSDWQSMAYLRAQMGDDALVTAAFTPDGRADAISRIGKACHFVLPFERQISFRQVVDWLGEPRKSSGVLYLQLQNGSLGREFASLAQDVDACGPHWARALGHSEHVGGDESRPLCNLWLGSSHSATTTHNDPFENLFMQVTGRKRFILWPPEDVAFMREREYPSGRYRADMTIDRSEVPVAWPMPAWPPDARASPMQVTLNEGELLYLPAMWWHSVRQVDSRGRDGPPRCLSVNWWYDLDFGGAHWAQWKLLERLTMLSAARLDECRADLMDCMA
ncbi:hypothetical protein PYCC9005_002465 [Savitreella phatthalungensis]